MENEEFFETEFKDWINKYLDFENIKNPAKRQAVIDKAKMIFNKKSYDDAVNYVESVKKGNLNLKNQVSTTTQAGTDWKTIGMFAAGLGIPFVLYSIMR